MKLNYSNEKGRDSLFGLKDIYDLIGFGNTLGDIEETFVVEER